MHHPEISMSWVPFFPRPKFCCKQFINWIYRNTAKNPLCKSPPPSKTMLMFLENVLTPTAQNHVLLMPLSHILLRMQTPKVPETTAAFYTPGYKLYRLCCCLVLLHVCPCTRIQGKYTTKNVYFTFYYIYIYISIEKATRKYMSTKFKTTYTKKYVKK